jgi:carboxypeptidase family protein
LDARAHPLRRRYGLELALGLGVVLVSLWLIARDGGEPRKAGGPGPAPSTPTRAAAAEPERASEPERDSARAEVHGSSSEKPASASTALLSVEVVDEHGAPLSGQRVSIRASRLGLPPETFEVHLTGADGVAAIPVAPLEELRAAAGTAYPRKLHASLEPPFEGAPLVALPEALAGARARLVVPEEDLRHLLPLRVRVVDAQGAPVGGVEVQLLARKLDERDFGPPRAAGTSRADGHAELDLTAFRQERRPDARGWQQRLQAWAPFAALPSLELGAELPAEVVMLRLPPSGSIAVKVDGAERALPEACVELLAPALVGQAQLASLRAPIVDGQALFPAVGLRLALQLRVRARGFRPLPPLELRGPSVACERVSATLELGAEWPRAALFAVDEHGDPLANQCFHGWVDGPMPPPSLEPSPRSDARGRLVFHVPGEPLPGETRRLCLRPADLGPFPPTTLALPAALEPGVVTELGTLVFPAPELPARPTRVPLASGHVVDEDGRPIGLANVILHATSGFSQPVSSAADGSFRIEDAPLDGALELIARCPGFLEARVAGLRPGATDLRVALAHAAVFEARVLLDDDLPMTRMYGRLESVGGGYPLELAEHVAAGEVPPGVYTFSVRASSGRRCLARVDGVRLAAGPNPVDPRLAPLDLRGRVVGVTARLETSDGSALLGSLSVRIDGQEEIWLADDEGRVRGVALRGQELELVATGFAPRKLVADGLETVLVFTPEEAR